MIDPWAAALSQNAAKYAVIDFGQAAKAWGAYRKRLKTGVPAGRRMGFPRFKRRKHEQGFRADNGPDTVRTDGKAVILPKIGRVAMVERLSFSGSIREVTVNRTAGRWFACFSVDTARRSPGQGRRYRGRGCWRWDAGGVLQWREGRESQGAESRTAAVAASGQGHCPLQECPRQGESQHRRERLYARRRKLHARTVDVRNDCHHKAAAAIAKSAGRVVVETLNVAGMIRNRRLARSITDAGMSGFLAKLEYKCLWFGAEMVKADRFFPSSKLCADCAWKNEDLTLSVRSLAVRMLRRTQRPRRQRLGQPGTMAGFELPGCRTWRLCKSGCAGSGP